MPNDPLVRGRIRYASKDALETHGWFKVTSTGGAAVGALAGALLGGPVGAAVGAVVGSLIGHNTPPR